MMAPEESRLGRIIQNQNAPRMGCRLGRDGNIRDHGPVRGLVWVEQFKIKMRPGWGAVWVEMFRRNDQFPQCIPPLILGEGVRG